MEKIRNKFISIFEVQLKEKNIYEDIHISLFPTLQIVLSFKKPTFVRVDYFDGK